MPPVSLFLFQGTGRLQSGPHPERARADAELLLMHLLRIDRAWLMAHSDAEFGADYRKPYDELLQRRRVGEPIQYITGETEFYGLPFRVTPDVLIPRPETEHLVEQALALAARFEHPRIVDVGTGSGAIAVALARHLSQAQIAAVDISAAALEIARENAERNAVSDRIRFLQGDLLGPVRDERFDIVVSNPPYVAAADRETLAVEVRDHEPALALFAGDDGFDIYRRLIPDGFAVLEPRGYMLLEIGYGQSAAVAALLTQAGFVGIEFVPDLQGIPRVVCGRRP
jgi:release factor glutamine methyltransferase